jgi:hypothetical protein
MWFISTILELRIWTKDLSFNGEEPTMKDLVSDGNRLRPASFLAVAMTVYSGHVVEEGRKGLAVN